MTEECADITCGLVLAMWHLGLEDDETPLYSDQSIDCNWYVAREPPQ